MGASVKSCFIGKEIDMDDSITVSVCMISYNHERFIRQALESVCNQKTTFQFEIIIGDDCSTDNTQNIIKEIAEQYPDLIIPVLRNKNLGATKNSYDIKKRASGKYIAILEGDDYWIDDYKLQKQVDFLEDHPEIYSVAHRNLIVDKDNNVIGKSHEKLELDRYFNKSDALKLQSELFHPSSILHRNFYKDVPQEAEQLEQLKTIGGHSLLIYYLVSKSDIYIFNQAMSAWRYLVENSGSNFQSVAIKHPVYTQFNILKMYCNYRNYFGNTYNFSPIIHQKLMGLCLLLILRREKDIKAFNFFYKQILPLISFKDLLSIPVNFTKILFRKGLGKHKWKI